MHYALIQQSSSPRYANAMPFEWYATQGIQHALQSKTPRNATQSTSRATLSNPDPSKQLTARFARSVTHFSPAIFFSQLPLFTPRGVSSFPSHVLTG